MSVNFKLIGRRVREVRTERGISQQELAARCKTSAQYLSQIENGRKQASLQVLVAVAEVLEISLNELLTGNQVNNPLEYQRDMVRLLADCSSYEKRVLFEMLLSMKAVLRENQNLLEKELEKF
ncbi:MAG: helix-turn-helix transcriptional regulator [Lachnospiraceae bacterium]|nr:helix-turn-helix transcriptional regulator [Lachnospiraceae bacterium]